MAILKRSPMPIPYYDGRINFYKMIDADAREIAENFVKGLPITEKILSNVYQQYFAAQKIEGDFNKDFFECAMMEFPFADEIVFYFSRIFFHISNIKEKNWIIQLRKDIGGFAPDIIITSNPINNKLNNQELLYSQKSKEEKIIAVVELRAKEWVRAFIVEDNSKNYWKGKKEELDIFSKESKVYFQKYADALKVGLRDVFVITPTLSVLDKDIMKSIANQQELFTQSTGIPESNLIILRENRTLSEEKTCTNYTTYFEKFLEGLVRK